MRLSERGGLVTDRGIPDAVRHFIADSIDSAEELDLLLLLHRTPDRAWDAETASQVVYSVPQSTRDRLVALARKGLAREQPGAAGGAFRYAPATAELTGVVEELASVYRERRAEVVSLVLAKGVDPLRSFADAFKLKKRDS